MVEGDQASIFPLDLVASRAVKRNISLSAAFKSLILAWNLVTARSLVRINIDTALHSSAAWLVENPNDFSMRVIAGKRIDRLKCKKSKKFSDGC